MDSYGKRIRDLRKTYKRVIAVAKQTVQSGKELTPVAFALTPHGVIVNGMLFHDYEEKRAMYTALGKTLRQIKASGAVLLNECWYLDQDSMSKEEREFFQTHGNMKTMPSNHPARKEMIAALLCTYGYTGAVLHPFRREQGRIIWEPERSTETDPEFKIDNYLFPAFEEDVH